ncbi:MAG: DUF4434 domain-containing protein [Dysgonomonas sp.]
MKEQNERRDFLKKMAITTGSFSVAGVLNSNSSNSYVNGKESLSGSDDKYRLIPKGTGLPITGTFLDEITWDIPSQNWGYDKWNKDFAAMKKMGIDTVVLIRGAFGRYMTFRSEMLMKYEGKYMYEPAFDLMGMFLDLADQYGMKFYCGIFDTGRYWLTGDFKKEVEINKLFLDEIQEKYGHHKSFHGWYLSQEVSRRTGGIVESFAEIGKHAKNISGGKPCLISPYIHGLKTDQVMSGDAVTTVEQHVKDWTEILSGIKGSVDILAFQDGQVDYHELKDYLVVNRELSGKYGMDCWTNVESFDRDMPIRFLPIRWDKLIKKLIHSQEAQMSKALTFEFSHFMSPNSAYTQAENLYRIYCEHFQIKK